MNGNTEETCACGGLIVSGHMFEDRFIYVDIDLHFALREKECLLKSFFGWNPCSRRKSKDVQQVFQDVISCFGLNSSLRWEGSVFCLVQSIAYSRHFDLYEGTASLA